MTPTPGQLDRLLDLLVDAVVRELQVNPEKKNGPRPDQGNREPSEVTDR